MGLEDPMKQPPSFLNSPLRNTKRLNPFQSWYVNRRLQLLGQTEGADRHGETLLGLIAARLLELSDADRANNPVSAIPTIFLPNLTRALAGAVSKDARWHLWLSELADNNRLPSDEE